MFSPEFPLYWQCQACSTSIYVTATCTVCWAVNVLLKLLRNLYLYYSHDLATFVCYNCHSAFQVWPPGIQCQICHVMFSDQSAISAHYDTAHSQSSRPPRPEHPDARYECEVCGRKFTEKGNLKKHMSTVHGVGDVKTFQCDICSRVFKEKSKLARHKKAVHKTSWDRVTSCRCWRCWLALWIHCIT